MEEEERDIDICCCCGKELKSEKEVAFVNFRYQVPGDNKPEKIVVAATCDPCAKEAEDPNLFPVIEVLINARIIRIESPTRTFTP
jgi:hypothetical protein